MVDLFYSDEDKFAFKAACVCTVICSSILYTLFDFLIVSFSNIPIINVGLAVITLIPIFYVLILLIWRSWTHWLEMRRKAWELTFRVQDREFQINREPR